MLCKDKLANLDFKSKKIMQNTFFFPFPLFLFFYFFYFFFYFFFFLERITKTTYHEMHECYAMKILKKSKKTKQKQQRGMVAKNRMMKHKDHVRKTKLDRAFCIQNILDWSYYSY